MGAKKKPNAKDVVEDNSTKDFVKEYKKSCIAFETVVYKPFEKKVVEIIEEGDGKLHEILINERIGDKGMKALCNALKVVNKGKGYDHCQSIRIWDGDIGSEGAKAVFEFITETNKTAINLLEFLNCNIDPIGCEYIARIFDPSFLTQIKILTLDYNNIGNEGFYQLVNGLKSAKVLTYLSLAHCNIDHEGIKFATDYIGSPLCTIESLVLAGNPLKNAGLNILIQCLFNNKSIEELNINNILFGGDEELVSNLANLMNSNLTLTAYQVKYNLFTPKEFDIMLGALTNENGLHIWQFLIDERVSKEQYESYFKAMKKRKKKPKGKKGGKKKGGKKKK